MEGIPLRKLPFCNGPLSRDLAQYFTQTYQRSSTSAAQRAFFSSSGGSSGPSFQVTEASQPRSWTSKVDTWHWTNRSWYCCIGYIVSMHLFETNTSRQWYSDTCFLSRTFLYISGAVLGKNHRFWNIYVLQFMGWSCHMETTSINLHKWIIKCKGLNRWAAQPSKGSKGSKGSFEELCPLNLATTVPFMKNFSATRNLGELQCFTSPKRSFWEGYPTESHLFGWVVCIAISFLHGYASRSGTIWL